MVRTFAVLLALGLALPAMAQDGVDIEKIGREVREGKIAVGKTYSTGFEEGARFHTIHVDVLGLACKSCHSGTAYQSDFIFLRKGEVLSALAPGQADRAVCLGCHQTGGPASTWYVGREAQ